MYDNYYEQLIIKYLNKFKIATSRDLRNLLDEKFSNVLNKSQKENKLRNMLQKMKRNNVIATANGSSFNLNEI